MLKRLLEVQQLWYVHDACAGHGQFRILDQLEASTLKLLVKWKIVEVPHLITLPNLNCRVRGSAMTHYTLAVHRCRECREIRLADREVGKHKTRKNYLIHTGK